MKSILISTLSGLAHFQTVNFLYNVRQVEVAVTLSTDSVRCVESWFFRL